ncbi:hypothetical protein LPJ38_11555 [Bradyrhizobium daqingense]|uniref:Uncharacterized protein n=1 Tax=Bradyrhizobium daqingense TaxID=993502 RepID=A0A562LDA7_9BRAD|nr:hypothetical protein [Bradyrhizobium daqingense]TWI05598.1 hypothetical protein IQ17_03098 [Bradyrhizobium daqingense]UFS91329.1 hypothetical protein LPJ38_11555 [Bradyrhizobium daqingense]
MLSTQRSLATAQIGRNSFQEIAESRTPLREATLEAFRRRNAVLDGFFYDIGKISHEEALKTAPWLAREGAILIVPPAGAGSLCLCNTVEDFASAGGADVRVLAVAGVGSSALGAAAFARNVADAFGVTVAAVVSGYGLADLLTEALGGWFWFGILNRLRHQFESLDEMSRALNRREVLNETVSPLELGRVSLDTRTVMALLSDRRFSFSAIAGHSKGNLVISEALYELERQPAGEPIPGDKFWIITVSAAVAMPPRYGKIIDVMGTIDGFGALNSTVGVSIEKRCALSWHHTNTDLPFHLPVTQAFRELISERNVTV